MDLAKSRGGEDNITVVLFEMEGQGLAALTGDERVSLETVQAFPG
jgi:serine/threonine protein phosphatase PrpC